uniref:Uncharacterized protein n=1 Tax=Glossina palpalis gambiensis TaxID=67801 RepID=A0A1B0BE81_9MUSC
MNGIPAVREFSFDNYEQEEDSRAVDITNVVDVDNQIADEDDDSEDEIIKRTDNLLLVGPVQDDAAYMEVWVSNEEEESLYMHHDFLLPSLPLCTERLHHDPGSDKSGNMCMDPIITVWDLDIQESLEPAFKLNSKKKSEKAKRRIWSQRCGIRFILESSLRAYISKWLSRPLANTTDLDEGRPHTTITAFKEKVQSLGFSPDEAQHILTGCADGRVRLFHCRDPQSVNSSFVKWKTMNEVEKVLWNPNSNNYFVVGDNAGYLLFADKHHPKNFLWSQKAHEEEISGVCFNTNVGNLLASTSREGCLKIWKFDSSEISPVYSHEFEMGRLQCVKQSPEDPFTLAFGGEKPPRCRMYNIKNFVAVRRAFDISDAENI